MKISKSKIVSSALFLGLLTSSLPSFKNNNLMKANASQGGIEFKWDSDDGYKKLRYLQSSDIKMDRASYFLFITRRQRRNSILKLTLQYPNYFNAKLKPNKFKLCQVSMGNLSRKTRCLKYIDAKVTISKDQTKVDIIPNTPIPVDKKNYAVLMKIFNPTRSGMFEISAYSQSTLDVPISSYLGTWTIAIR